MPPITDLVVAAGVVCVRDGAVLLVREKGRWGLPKGGREPGESLAETAWRETREECGVEVEVGDVAYVMEFIERDGHSRTLQVFFEGRWISGEPKPDDPDGEIEEARLVPIAALAEFLTAPHRRLPLLAWLDGRRGGHHFIDLSV